MHLLNCMSRPRVSNQARLIDVFYICRPIDLNSAAVIRLTIRMTIRAMPNNIHFPGN